MGKYASQVVKQAKAWLGKKESNSTHKEIIDVYNSHKPLARGYAVKYTDAWCATFVSAVAIKLDYTTIIPKECGCQEMIKLFQNMGCYIENENRTPSVGDIVFYDWGDNGIGDNKGYADHVGIVVNVSRETFSVIEGNYDNQVKERTLQINGRYIRGFGVPKYDKEVVSQPSENVSKPSESIPNPITEIAKLVIKGKYGNGHETRKARIYEQVRSEVNHLCGYKATFNSVPKCITDVARLVIKSVYGNGHETRAKNIYEQVRSEVNRLV